MNHRRNHSQKSPPPFLTHPFRCVESSHCLVSAQVPLGGLGAHNIRFAYVMGSNQLASSQQARAIVSVEHDSGREVVIHKCNTIRAVCRVHSKTLSGTRLANPGDAHKNCHSTLTGERETPTHKQTRIAKNAPDQYDRKPCDQVPGVQASLHFMR